jgi:F-type H+-transporting ATPase subunit O
LHHYQTQSPTGFNQEKQQTANHSIVQYTAAAKSSALDPTAKAMDSLLKVFEKDAKLAVILRAPSLTPTDQKAIVAELEKHTGGSPNEVVKNFLSTLAQNNRLGALEGVCEKFAQLMGAHRGEVELVVTSATPLDQKVLKQLEAAISKSKYVQQGQKLKLVSKVSFSGL